MGTAYLGVSFTQQLIYPAITSLEELTASEEKRWVFSQLVPRAEYLLLLTPAAPICIAIDTFVGVGAGFLGVFLQHPSSLKVAATHLRVSELMFVVPYATFLRAIDPKRKLVPFNAPETSSGSFVEFVRHNSTLRWRQVAGAPSELDQLAEKVWKDPESFWKRGAVSRLVYLLEGFTLLGCAAGALASSVGPAVSSVFILLFFKTGESACNASAFVQLQAAGCVISGLFYCMIKVIYPGAPAEKFEEAELVIPVLSNDGNKDFIPD